MTRPELQKDTETTDKDNATNSVDEAALRIRQAVMDGSFKSGDRLKLGELSTKFGLSAMPLREALRKLEGEGLVEIAPNRGATVRKLDRAFIEDLYELNTELQILAIRKSEKTLTLGRLEQLERRATDFAEAVARASPTEAIRFNRDLHADIVELGGNREALRIFLLGWELIGAFRMRFGYSTEREHGLVREHRILLDALGKQDLQAAEAIIRMQHAAMMEDLISRVNKLPE